MCTIPGDTTCSFNSMELLTYTPSLFDQDLFRFPHFSSRALHKVYLAFAKNFHAPQSAVCLSVPGLPYTIYLTAWPNGMSHRKWRETKQPLIWLPDMALPVRHPIWPCSVLYSSHCSKVRSYLADNAGGRCFPSWRGIRWRLNSATKSNIYVCPLLRIHV